MAKKRLTANLSVSSIKNLQKELERYKEGLNYKAKLFAERLAERGVEIARVQIADLDAIFTGELIQSIHSEYKGSAPSGAIFAVVAGTNHCAMVEFGTGWKGKNTPYPHPLPEGVSWEYNTGKTIRYNEKKGTYYWFYPDKDGSWHYTEGMPSRPFMFNTATELRNAKLLGEVAKEVFG